MLYFYNMEKNILIFLTYFIDKLNQLFNGAHNIKAIQQVKSKIALTFGNSTILLQERSP